MPIAKQDAIGGALSLLLGLSLLIWLIPNWVEPDDDLRLPTSLLPRIVAYALLTCGAVMVVKSVLRRDAGSDMTPRFAGPEFGKFIAMIAIMLAATFGFQQFHFLIVAPVLVAITMWMFGPIRLVSLVLTSTLGPLIIWLLGTQVLGRVLP